MHIRMFVSELLRQESARDERRGKHVMEKRYYDGAGRGARLREMVDGGEQQKEDIPKI